MITKTQKLILKATIELSHNGLAIVDEYEICPNCSNKLPDELFVKLQSAAKLLMEVNDNANKKDNSHLTHANPNHFYFQIQK